MVSAWARNNHMVLGQVKVDNKSKVDNKGNEITPIPVLLKLLEFDGCIVTIDGMGCQKEIARRRLPEPLQRGALIMCWLSKLITMPCTRT